MRNFVLVAMALAGFAAPAAAAVFQEKAGRTFDAADLVRVEVRNARGSIEIGASDDGAVHLSAIKITRAASMRTARERARRIHVRTVREGDALVVEVEYPGDARHWGGVGWISSEHRRSRGEVRLVVAVPPGIEVRAATASGDVRSRGISADQDLRAASGDIQVVAAGGEVRATTASGDIRVTGVGAARVTSSSGSIAVRDASGSVSARSASGSISIAGVGDSVTVSSSSGHIRVDGARHGLRASTASGAVVTRAAAGAVQASSASGSLRLDLVAPLTAAEASTASGSIHVSLAGDIGCRLSLASRSGALSVSQPMRPLSSGRRQISGVIGEGETPVNLRSVSGSIRVVGREDG